MPEGDIVLGTGSVRGNPDLVAIGISRPWPVEEVLSQKTEFPKLIRDVLPHVRDSAVRTDNHLAVVFRFLPVSFCALLDVLERRRGHDPATLVLALRLEIDRVPRFQ